MINAGFLERFKNMELTFTCNYGLDRKDDTLPQKYIINKGAAILFWKDGTKTISKRNKYDKFDKELGFLLAYYYKRNAWKSKNDRKKVFSYLKEEHVKDYVFMAFKQVSGMSTERARKYLANLEVEKDEVEIL